MKVLAPRSRAFSLVEVVIALAVVSFCLLTVLALLPISATQSRDTLEQTTAASIASEISSDFHVAPHIVGTTTNTPRFNISYAPNGVSSLYFGGDDTFSTTSSGASVYRATVTVGATPTYATNTVPLRILITWPGLADSNPALSPTQYSGSLEIATAVNTASP